MSELTDKTKQLLIELDQMGLDEEGVPEEIKNLGSDPSEEEQNKANHAYIQLKEKLRVAKGVIGQQADELKKAGERKPPAPTPPAPLASDPQQQSAFYMATLQTRAMQRIGVPDVNSPLVQMEIQRLYSQDMETAERQVTAVKDAEKVLDTVYSEFPQLGDDDKAVINEHLSAQDVLARTDGAFVKEAIHAYIGANLEKFSKKAPEKNESKIKKSTVASSGAAAISKVKAQGTGVEPSEANPNGEAEVKPANSEELKEMKKLSIPPEQVAIYRKAKLKKLKYSQ